MVYDDDLSQFRPDGSTKSGGWSKTGKLVTGNQSQRVNAQVEFPNAGPYTVQFTLTPGTGADFSFNPITAEADIFWSVEGNTVKRTVSVMDGMAISGFGQAVNVIIRDTTFDLALGPQGKEYDVTLNITPGTRPSENQPATLAISDGAGNYFFDLAAGASGVIPLPDAGAISVCVTAVSTLGDALPEGKAQVDQVKLDPTFVVIAHTKLYDPRDYEWVPLTPGVNGLRIVNLTAGAGATTVRFSVTLGIDG